MKRLFCVCLSLILLLTITTFAFADEIHLLDPISGEIVDENGNSSSTVKLSTKCKYDFTDEMFIYSTGTTTSTDIMCSVYNGMITTDPVVIKNGDSANIEVYKDGQLVDKSEYEYLSEPGSYVVNNVYNSQEVLSFIIASLHTGKISMYKVPSIFYISSARYNDENLELDGNMIRFDKDGLYHIEYVGNKTNVGYTLDLHVDLTYPQLEINGLDDDGIARGPVTFGTLEPDSTLLVTVDGKVVNPINNEYTTAGDYVVKYSDRAGNVSSYYFTMGVFFNLSAYLFVGIAGAVIVAAIVYMIYTRKNRRVR